MSTSRRGHLDVIPGGGLRARGRMIQRRIGIPESVPRRLPGARCRAEGTIFQWLSPRQLLAERLHIGEWVAFQNVAHGTMAEEEGARSWSGERRSHLPLRGKLGWMTPMTRSRLGRVTERGFRGCRSQAVAPLFLPGRLIRVDAPYHRNLRHPQHVFHFRFLEPRGIVLEVQPVPLLVETESMQTVGVGEKRQRAQLVLPQRRLELVGHGHECHAGIIADMESPDDRV